GLVPGPEVSRPAEDKDIRNLRGLDAEDPQPVVPGQLFQHGVASAHPSHFSNSRVNLWLPIELDADQAEAARAFRFEQCGTRRGAGVRAAHPDLGGPRNVPGIMSDWRPGHRFTCCRTPHALGARLGPLWGMGRGPAGRETRPAFYCTTPALTRRSPLQHG